MAEKPASKLFDYFSSMFNPYNWAEKENDKNWLGSLFKI